MNRKALGGVAAIWLTLAAAGAMAPGAMAPGAMAPGAMAQEARTLKERLSDKASDAQRVDNCKVPADRRGPVPRPGCPTKPRPPSPAAEAVPPAGRR